MSILAQLEPLQRLTKDTRKAAITLSAQEARYLVDTYYSLQKFRIETSNQVFALNQSEEPHDTLGFFFGQFKVLEGDIQKALDTYSAAQPLGEWARLHVGVGPVIAAGLLAHIPIEKTPSVSSLWRFAGLAPGQRYVKGEKRDWNAGLKVLCWKLGDSFVKQSGREQCYYGHLYLQRKIFEGQRNEAGGNAEAAAKQLKEKQIRDAKLKKTLEGGKLPEGQLLMRARRYAVKRFLAHYWQQAYWFHYGTEPPRAYVFEHMGHVHEEHNPYVPIFKHKATA